MTSGPDAGERRICGRGDYTELIPIIKIKLATGHICRTKSDVTTHTNYRQPMDHRRIFGMNTLSQVFIGVTGKKSY